MHRPIVRYCFYCLLQKLKNVMYKPRQNSRLTSPHWNRAFPNTNR